jgi:hypothetical protein
MDLKRRTDALGALGHDLQANVCFIEASIIRHKTNSIITYLKGPRRLLLHQQPNL